MSFNRLNYDWNAYQADLRQSVGSGMYSLDRPGVEEPCLSSEEGIKASSMLPSAKCADRALVDVSSDLLGITRRASRDPNQNYFPGDSSCRAAPLRDCGGIHAEDTRLSNPTMTLKGTGWNRWEWPCNDPQMNAFVPFDHNIANRIVAKDNHRPYLQRPIDQSAALPPANASEDVVTYGSSMLSSKQQDGGGVWPSTTWKKCKYYTDEYGEK